MRSLLDLLNDAAETNYSEYAPCDLNGRYINGIPLHIFASRGDTEACQLLIDAGSEIDVLDPDGYTPLHCAVLQGHTSVVELLIKHGADWRIDSRIGTTCFLAEDYPEILALLGGGENGVSAR